MYRKEVDFSAAFVDIARRGALPEEASNHTGEMTAIEEDSQNMGNIYRISVLYKVN